MERLNLNFSGSEKSISSGSSSQEDTLVPSTFNSAVKRQRSLDKNRSSTRLARETLKENIRIFKNEVEISHKTSLKEKVTARYKKFYDNRKFMQRWTSSVIRNFNRDSVVSPKKKNSIEKSSKSIEFELSSHSNDSLTKIDALKNENILKYRKHLLTNDTVRRTASKYKLFYFIQFWFVFLVTIFINIFAWILIVLEDMYRDQDKTWDVFELILMVYFIIEFIISVIIFKPPRYKMLLDWGTYIDLITILPRLIMLIMNVDDTTKFSFFRILRIFKIFRIMRILKFLRKLKSRRTTEELSFERPALSPLANHILILVVSLLSTLFISAGFVIFIDDEMENAWTFDINYIDAIYYITVTGSTLGYGDIAPIRAVSRFTIIFVLVIIIYIFANQLNKIIDIIYKGDSYDKKINLKNHVVIFLYNDNLEILTSFLLYYLRYEKEGLSLSDLKNGSKILLICDRQKGISPEVKQYLKIKIFQYRLKYLPSKKAVDRRLIDRGWLQYAREIYFLSDPRDEISSNLDKMSIIYAHFLKNHGVACNIYIQNANEHSDFRDWDELDDANRAMLPSIDSYHSFMHSNSLTSNDKISSAVDITCTQHLIMKAMARNLFHQGFIQFLSSMLIDPLETTNSETYWVYVVKFSEYAVGVKFDEVSFLYDKVCHAIDFKDIGHKYVLFGVIRRQDDNSECVDIAPLTHYITENDKALVLCNMPEVAQKLETEGFSALINLFKLKFFQNALKSPSKRNRGSVNQKRSIVDSSERGSAIIDGPRESLKEPLMDHDTFSNLFSGYDRRAKRNTVRISQKDTKDSLNKDHEDFDGSINNKSFKKILESSIKSMLKRKFAYQMLLEEQQIDVSAWEISDDLSGHILILGYHKGCNSFIESVRQESDIPICILSDTINLAEIKRIIWMFPNVIHFIGSPLDFVHIKNSNIENALHVIIPSKTEEELSVSDTNAVFKANLIKQNWPDVNISVEFTSNYMTSLIENVLNNDIGKKLKDDMSTVYTSKGYLNGKVFSSVLFSRMWAMKILQNQWYNTITSLLEHNLHESNIISLKIPNHFKDNDDLTYGNVKEYILFNRSNEVSLNLLCIGVYVIDSTSEFVKDTGIITDGTIDITPNRSSSVSWIDHGEELSLIWDDFSSTYDQYILELKNSRKFIMSPYDDFKLSPNDYILCLGNIEYDAVWHLAR